MRPRFVLVVLAGVASLAIAATWIFFLLLRKSEVDLLVDIMKDGTGPDAAWAFARLEDLDTASLEGLFPYITSDERTSLHMLSWGYVRRYVDARRSQSGGGPEAFTLGQVARFVLGGHYGFPVQGFQGEQYIEKLVRARKEGRPRRPAVVTESPPSGKRGWWIAGPAAVVPPGRVKETAAMLAAADVDGLLRLLKSDNRPEAVWALEVLRGLHDEAYEKLIPHATDSDVTRVTCLAWEGGCGAIDDGHTVGQLVRYLLWTRIGQNDSDLWRETPPPPRAVQGLRPAWRLAEHDQER